MSFETVEKTRVRKVQAAKAAPTASLPKPEGLGRAIPEFPKFRNLEISDRGVIGNFAKLYPPYSDFNFVSMWCWDTANKTEISLLNENLVVRFEDYTSDKIFFSFIGLNNVDSTVRTLLKFSEEAVGQDCLRLIPGHIKEKIVNTDRCRLLEERGGFDYIYDLAAVYGYRGGPLKQKRHLVNSFVRKYSDAKAVVLDLRDHRIQDDIISIITLSANEEGSGFAHDRKELQAITRLVELIELSDQSSIIPLGIYVSGKLVAFNITEVVHDNYAIVHFEKADFKSYPEVGAYIFHEVMKILLSRKVRYINLEQDLDIEGLRQNKMSYRPIGFLRKYKVENKG